MARPEDQGTATPEGDNFESGFLDGAPAEADVLSDEALGLTEPTPEIELETTTETEPAKPLLEEVDPFAETPPTVPEPVAAQPEPPAAPEPPTALELEVQRLRSEIAEFKAAQPVAPPQTFEQRYQLDPDDPDYQTKMVEAVRQDAIVAATRQVSAQNVETAINSFFASHPEVAPGSAIDQQITAAVQEYAVNEQGQIDTTEFPITKENLDVLYEAIKEPAVYALVRELNLIPDRDAIAIAKEAAADPALANYFRANPHLLDSEAGVSYAREEVAFRKQFTQAQANVAPPNQSALRRKAFVETGGQSPVSGAPGQGPRDDFSSVEAHISDQRRRSSFLPT